MGLLLRHSYSDWKTSDWDFFWGVGCGGAPKILSTANNTEACGPGDIWQILKLSFIPSISQHPLSWFMTLPSNDTLKNDIAAVE